ncbi:MULTISPECIES: hypothetical protein [Streptomyces]
MICARCDKQIEGEPEPVVIETGSSVSATIYICPVPCRPARQQTYPVK